jgi:metal-responsive CopG/Arc/MetJ family transcriptional regulator
MNPMTKTISIRIDASLLRSVDEALEGRRRSRSAVFREALEMWLRQRRLDEKIRRHREGYSRHPVRPDEFEPILRAQRWPT